MSSGSNSKTLDHALLKCKTYVDSRTHELRLTKAVVLIEDLVKFARRQPVVQEILLSDTVVIQHNGMRAFHDLYSIVCDQGKLSICAAR